MMTGSGSLDVVMDWIRSADSTAGNAQGFQVTRKPSVNHPLDIPFRPHPAEIMSMRTVSLLLLLLSAPVPVLGETLIIPFDVHRTKSVLLVEAEVNGKKARLILDTGAS